MPYPGGKNEKEKRENIHRTNLFVCENEERTNLTVQKLHPSFLSTSIISYPVVTKDPMRTVNF